MKNKSTNAFLKYFRKNQSVYSQTDVEEIVEEAIKAERKRVSSVLDSFLVEDEFYSKGMIEIQIEIIINAIKRALQTEERNT